MNGIKAKRIRQSYRMSQENFGKVLKLSPATISRYESGVLPITGTSVILYMLIEKHGIQLITSLEVKT